MQRIFSEEGSLGMEHMRLLSVSTSTYQIGRPGKLARSRRSLRRRRWRTKWSRRTRTIRGRSGRSASSGQFLSSGSIWSVGKFWGSPWRIRVSDGPGERAQRKGRVALPNQMNFRKNSKRPSTPLPHFRKIMLHIAHDRYGCIYARRYDGQLMWNACTWFPEIGTSLRSGGWGSTALWNLSKNSSDLVARPVP